MANSPTYISPTEPEYYADEALFPDANLEKIIAKSAADGSYIAVNSGADHPLAAEHAKIWAAATFALIIRQTVREAVEKGTGSA